MATCYNLEEVLNYLVAEQNKGELTEDNINEYSEKLGMMMKMQSDNPEFVEDFRSAFKNI